MMPPSGDSMATPAAMELASAHTMARSPVQYHSPRAGSAPVRRSHTSAICARSDSSSVTSSHPLVTAFARLFSHAVAGRSQLHTGRCDTSRPVHANTLRRVRRSGGAATVPSRDQ